MRAERTWYGREIGGGLLEAGCACQDSSDRGAAAYCNGPAASAARIAFATAAEDGASSALVSAFGQQGAQSLVPCAVLSASATAVEFGAAGRISYAPQTGCNSTDISASRASATAPLRMELSATEFCGVHVANDDRLRGRGLDLDQPPRLRRERREAAATSAAAASKRTVIMGFPLHVFSSSSVRLPRSAT